ncbi:serine/threonine protein kinase [Actinomadura craniellae]|uniref:Serine/threonine protein kinase n=1 Tax=Actinomadura craniellae TaxID=2231787 RepID=A0A365H145_9ACTN|nr:serine/threonine-protein kinase [Actinomadura craniellae]RAY12815.1 serine/threonine protein kinase [Actinomadura craniellae]
MPQDTPDRDRIYIGGDVRGSVVIGNHNVTVSGGEPVQVAPERPAAPGPPADPLRAGDPAEVGGHRLVGRLGEGGMGRVYLGRTPGGRMVAVKVVWPRVARSPGYRQRFAQEVSAARRVGGFHTAQVVAADPDADLPWIATAYIPGPSLDRAVTERGPLPVAEVRALGAGLAEGLAAIHACGLVHRDLKPGNILLADDGPRIIDFGIARLDDRAGLTRPGMVLGTPAYMSPEQARREPVEAPSDVFSLGAVLAFAALGDDPFGPDGPETAPDRIAGLDGLPAGLRRTVEACLAPRPADRPGPRDLLAAFA